MDQSASLQGQDEVCMAKLAMVGVTVCVFNGYYFLYLNGCIMLCGHDLGGLTQEMLSNLQKGLYA